MVRPLPSVTNQSSCYFGVRVDRYAIMDHQQCFGIGSGTCGSIGFWFEVYVDWILVASCRVLISCVLRLRIGFNRCVHVLFSQKNAKVALEYKQDYVFSNAALDVFKGPSVSADVSVGYAPCCCRFHFD